MINGAGQIPDHPKSHNIVKLAPAQSQGVAFKPGTKLEAAGGRDQVILSPQARTANVITSKIKTVPETRHDRIAEARAKVGKSGNSASQNARIAEKLLTEH